MNLSVGIPNSSLMDESTKINKAKKISLIARACAIFKIKQIIIYHERNESENDSMLLSTLLRYMETPQYLRKQLFPKMRELKYAGILSPLKISSHLTTSEPSMIKIGDVREGLIINYKGKKFVDIGINYPLPYYGQGKPLTRIATQITEIHPRLLAKEISREQVNEYWGYKVKERSGLFSLLSSWQGNIILTSKKGKIFTQSMVKKYSDLEKPTLVVFGSPKKGVHDILGNNIKKVQNSSVYNFFPDQATETVRFEEALFGTLSILNILSNNNTKRES